MKRFAVGLVAVVAALAVPLAMPGAAVANPVVIPVNPLESIPLEIPTSLEGVGASTGTVGLTEGCSGVIVLCYAAAGVGAFQGTCMYLGHHYKGGTDCSWTGFTGGLTHLWHNVFGSKGDNRSNVNGITSGPSSANPVGPSSSAEWQTVNATPSTSAKIIHKVCLNPNGTGSEWTRNNGSYSGGLDIITTCGSGSWTTVWSMVPGGSYCDTCGSSLVHLWVTGSDQVIDWYGDHGGVPWTSTMTVTCRKGTVTATGSTSTTYTPAPNTATPDMTIPDCDAILPGSHVDIIQQTGGRQGAPEVVVTKPTFTPATKANYPLCADNAPQSGCYENLLKLGRSCYDYGVYCAGWTDPANIGDYTCTWGPYKLAISVCQADLATNFDTETQTQPTTSTSTGAAPGAAPDNSNCSFSWGMVFNPAEWVVAPLKCAFIPTKFPNLNGVSNPVPAGWFPIIPGFGDGGCGPVTLPSLTLGHLFPSTGPLTLFNTCSSPWPTVHVFTYYGLLASVLMGGGFRALRMVMRAFGVDLESDSGP